MEGKSNFCANLAQKKNKGGITFLGWEKKRKLTERGVCRKRQKSLLQVTIKRGKDESDSTAGRTSKKCLGGKA